MKYSSYVANICQYLTALNMGLNVRTGFGGLPNTKGQTSLCIGTVCLFVCFVALRPKSTAMVIAGQSVHLTTLFPGQA